MRTLCLILEITLLLGWGEQNPFCTALGKSPPTLRPAPQLPLLKLQREAWGVPSKTLKETRGQEKAQSFCPCLRHPSGTCESPAQGAQQQNVST